MKRNEVIKMIELKNITIGTIKDNRTLIQDFNLSVQSGDKFAIIGEEGNGKSTLLKLIYDLTDVVLFGLTAHAMKPMTINYRLIHEKIHLAKVKYPAIAANPSKCTGYLSSMVIIDAFSK